jgi:hypothetical protein
MIDVDVSPLKTVRERSAMSLRVRSGRKILSAVAIITASLFVGVSPAAAGVESLGLAEVTVVGAGATFANLGVHEPSAAERNALPASIRDSVTTLSGNIKIANANSGYCMTVYGNGTANYSKIVSSPCRDIYPGQKWVRVNYDIARWNFYNPNSGKCLDTSSNHADGVQMIIYTCGGNDVIPTAAQNQLFYVLASGSNVTIRPSWNSGRCVEVYRSSLSSNAIVDHWACNGTRTQEWFWWIL